VRCAVARMAQTFVPAAMAAPTMQPERACPGIASFASVARACALVYVQRPTRAGARNDGRRVLFLDSPSACLPSPPRRRAAQASP
jgi:hypothetical protein